MMKLRCLRLMTWVVSGWLVSMLLGISVLAEDDDPTLPYRKATVKIITTYIHPSYTVPWRMQSHSTHVGSGAIIGGNRILTNAHVVSDATFIQVQKENDPKKYEAKPLFIGHECDLALIRVIDDAFFHETLPLDISEHLPKLKSVVATFGYPIGGRRISITEGVVSRIEIGTYLHSRKAAFLRIQTDAAINPGDSGGPVIQGDRMVGVAFQGIKGADNIGYMIPAPIIRHFFKDVEDGRFDGSPDLGILDDNLENEQSRRFRSMGKDQSGRLITRVISGSSAEGHLKPGDVILAIDGIPIANDGSIPFKTGRIMYSHRVDMRQIGEEVTLSILRNGLSHNVTFPLKVPPVRIPWFNEFETLPRYVVFGGIVFQPLSQEYLKARDAWRQHSDSRMLYYFYYLEQDILKSDRKEIVMLSRVLRDPGNTYISDISDKIVASINDMKILAFDDVTRAFLNPRDGYHVIQVVGSSRPIVLSADEMDAMNHRIAEKYNIPALTRVHGDSGYGR